MQAALRELMQAGIASKSWERKVCDMFAAYLTRLLIASMYGMIASRVGSAASTYT